MNPTSIARYKKHKYSGPRKSRKRVTAQLKRHHSISTSREDVWRKKSKKNETFQSDNAKTPRLYYNFSREDVWRKKSKNEAFQRDNAKTPSVKTYERQVPIYHKEATFVAQKCPPSSTIVSSETEALDINWPVIDPTVSCHQLTVEKTVDDNLKGLTGNRIIEIQHVLRWAFGLENHRKFCENSVIEFVNELRDGFKSIFTFKCSMCDKVFRKTNEKEDKLNKAFVWGTVTGGGYYTQAAHMTNVMDIPTISANKYRKIECSLGDLWQDQLIEDIKKVGEQERKIAIEKGQISSDGIPYIEVYVDGGWAKRSYGHDYNSASGMILANTKLPLYGRKLLKSRLSKLTIISRKIIMHNKNDKVAMRSDLQHGPSHVFGQHDKCKSYYCKYLESGEKDENFVENMKKQASAVWALICAANELVMAKTNRLSSETTNHVENFMSVMSKFNCGKRLNLNKAGSYQRRVLVAGLSQVSGLLWHRPAWRKCTASSPGKTFKKYITQTENTKVRRKCYTRRKLFFAKPIQTRTDNNYGPQAQDTIDTDPVDIDNLSKMISDKLLEFQKTAEEIKSIEEGTIGQYENDLYNIHRSDRLTASQFGLICKRRKSTPCHNHVKLVLYKNNILTNDMLYGQQNESVARTYFIENYQKSVRQAGLFIDEEYGFLGASPDGVVCNEDAILEIKCFPSLSRNNQDLLTAVKERKNFPVIEKSGVLVMNEKHSYYYQVQGQLRVTKMKKCYFICFISPSMPITVLEVPRNEEFIKMMVPKLVDFYLKSIMPEIVLRRVPKGAKCIDLE